MRFESRLRRLEKKYLKSADYHKGMKIMEQIAKGEDVGSRDDVPNSLLLLWELGRTVAEK